MTATRTELTYFNVDGRAIFGALHFPASKQARAGVVICSSVALEGEETIRGLHYVADELAARGFAALRFDYLNTGESFGDQTAPDAVSNWLKSISHAVEYMRSIGVDEVTLIGHRVGSLLAVNSGVLDEISELVLWDPVLSGRRFVQGQKLLYNVLTDGEGAESDDVEIAGLSLHPIAAKELSRLRCDATRLAPDAADVAIAFDPNESDDTFLDEARIVGVDVFDVGEQSSFRQSNHPTHLRYPRVSAARIVTWLDNRVTTQQTPINVEVSKSAVTNLTAAGDKLTTSITTTPEGSVIWETRSDSCNPDLVFVAHSLGSHGRYGPARVWRETADLVAGRGGRSIRFDRPRVGEATPVLDSDEQMPQYEKRAADDAVRMIPHLGTSPGMHVLHAGICLGSWSAANAAAATPDTSSLVLVNPLHWSLAPYGRLGRPLVSGSSQSPRINKLKSLGIMGGVRLPRYLRRAVPRRFRSAVTHWTPIEFPEVLFEELAGAAVQTRIVFAPHDFEVFTASGGLDMREWFARNGYIVPIVTTEAGDHPSLHRSVRDAARDECLRGLGLTVD